MEDMIYGVILLSWIVFRRLDQGRVVSFFGWKLICLFLCDTERQKSEILEMTEECEISIDCLFSHSNTCIEYRDNSTTMPRWLRILENGLHSVDLSVDRNIKSDYLHFWVILILKHLLTDKNIENLVLWLMLPNRTILCWIITAF